MSRNQLIGLAVGAAMVLVLVLRPAAAQAPPGNAPAPTAAASASRPRLLDLGATSCVPCKAMVPVLEGLRTDYAGRLDVDFIDVWEHREAGEAWGVKIIPTQIFLAADGRELARHQGFLSREDILAQWKKLGVALD